MVSWNAPWTFLDNHSGSITAIATVAIVVLTFFYVSYSKRQWEAMLDSNRRAEQQLRDYEERESARLVVENFTPEITSGPSDTVIIKGKFVVTNAGATVASEIYQISSHWGAIKQPDPPLELEPIPVPNASCTTPA